MAKQSYVLDVLSILGLERILKLSEVLRAQGMPLKKAAGEDLVSWGNAPSVESVSKKIAPEEAQSSKENVLSFPKKNITDFKEYRLNDGVSAEKAKNEEDGLEVRKVITSDLLLWQREVARECGEAIQKDDAMKSYKKSTEMYVVKTQTKEGKEKIRFASTNGILVNKKQT